MAPKKAAAAPKKAAGTAPAHASYQDMISEAIINLKERNGSSRQAIKKYVLANNNLGNVTDAMLSSHFNKALTRGSDTGVFERPKGASGPVKLAHGKKAGSPPAKKTEAKTEKKDAPKKAAAKPKAAAAKKATTTKTAAPKKAAAAKKDAPAKAKAAPKAAATKKAAPAKATKAKANSSKPRKSAAAAPAVGDKPPVVLGKTKSGRVTKTTAATAPKKAAAAKKAPAAKKAAAPKKSTPKKAAA